MSTDQPGAPTAEDVARYRQYAQDQTRSAVAEAAHNDPFGVGSPHTDTDNFWRARLCEALGLPPSTTNDALGQALSIHQSWRDRAALFLKKPLKISTSDLLAAHADHLESIRRVNSAAPVQNARARQDIACGLMNALTSRGIKFDAAFQSVRTCYPNLFR